MSNCSVEHCNQPFSAKGMCKQHYNLEHYKTYVRKSPLRYPCAIDNCRNSIRARGYCRYHYRKNAPILSETSEYYIWMDMKARCYSKKDVNYHNYGGRGISICDSWLQSFSNFLEDVGKRPNNKYSIDRINSNGNYEPENIRWATIHQQTANRRSNTGNAVGVHYDKFCDRWFATLQVDGKYVLRRSFKYETEAIVARREAEEKWNIVIK